MHRMQQQPTAVAAAAAPVIDNTQLPKPILLKCEDEGSISVKISGFPRPAVRWQIGRKRIKESSKYHLKNDASGLNHTLVIARVTSDIDQGVWVIATNQHGEDCCLLEVKTYNMLSGQRTNNGDSAADKNHLSGDEPKKVRKKKPRGSSHDTQSIVSLDTYKAEMNQRKRMRSADDLNSSIDAQSAYSERLFSPEPMGGTGPRPLGSTRVSRRDQMATSFRGDKRYSSTEAVHNELRSSSIPPVSFDEQSFASASSIPGTPYEERHMPGLTGNMDQSQKPAKAKKSKRSRSASLTNQLQDGDDNLPRRKKVPRVPKTTVSSAANNPEDPEKQKPPRPPTSSKTTTEDQSEVSGTKPRKKKLKKRTTSNSSVASANTLDKSLEDWDKPNPSPGVNADQEVETLQLSGETTGDISTSQITQLSRAEILTSCTDDNKGDSSTCVTDDNKEDSSTSVKDENQGNILTPVVADISNDLWDLFGMKLNALCHYLLNEKHVTSNDQTKMKNRQINNQTNMSDEYIDDEAVVAVENKVGKSATVTDGVYGDFRMKGVMLTSDESNNKLPAVTEDQSPEKKPPTGKKKKKGSKASNKDSTAKTEDKNSEYHRAMNGTHESAVDDDVYGRSEIPNSKIKDTETRETPVGVSLKNQSLDILVPQNISSREINERKRVEHPEKQLNAGKKREDNAPTLNFKHDVNGSDHEKQKSTKDTQIDFIDFNSNRLNATSWERREFEDIMTTKVTTPSITTPSKTSLKPARSEESLAMRTRSETDADYGRRSDLLTATGRLRVARSVDRLTADSDREERVPLIKRRSLSKEWQVVTVTTREEIVLVQKGKNEMNHMDAEPARQIGVENSDANGSSPKPGEIKYIDSEDSMDMDDFTWPSPPPMANNEMPPLTREYAVKQVNAGVRIVVPLTNGTTSNVDKETSLKPSPPRIESTIRNRIETLSLYGYNDKKPKSSDSNASHTQESFTSEPDTPEIPPPVNLDSFPGSRPTQVHSPYISTADVVLSPNNSVENFPRTASITRLITKSVPVVGDDEVFSDKVGENGGRTQTETETPYETRSISQDTSTQTDQTDNTEQFQNDSASPKVDRKPNIIQTDVFVVENKDKSRFELVANSCRQVNKKEEKREESEPQNAYYVVEHNKSTSPVIIHEYGELLSFCKKPRSLSEAELNILKTRQHKLEIERKLLTLWSQSHQRIKQLMAQKSHESHVAETLNAHLTKVKAEASSRLAETKPTYSFETFRTSPTSELLTSASVGPAKLGFYSKRPFSDSAV